VGPPILRKSEKEICTAASGGKWRVIQFFRCCA
jgi:hypothetical protein